MIFDIRNDGKVYEPNCGDLCRSMDLCGFATVCGSIPMIAKSSLLSRAYSRIGVDVLYMIVERLENDVHLRKQFDLPDAR